MLPPAPTNSPIHEHTDVAATTDGDPGSSGPADESGGRPEAARSAFARSVIETVSRSGKWRSWSAVEPGLVDFADLEDALEGWRRHDPRCYRAVAGLTALGSRRGGDDDDAALAVVVLLEDGARRVASTLRDLCELDDVTATLWEEVKSAEPQLGPCAARYLLKRARQRLSRPAAGMVSRLGTTSLEQRLETSNQGAASAQSTGAGEDQDRHLLLAVPAVEDPVADLGDLLTWATGTGVLLAEEVRLIVELLAAENDGLPREAAQRFVGQHHGVGMRTIRRRRDAIAARLRRAAPAYLSATA